jgi:hypothetical protein
VALRATVQPVHTLNLYAYTVKSAVYRVRQRGLRLPRPQAAVSGDLVLEPYTDHTGRPALRAKLRSTGALIPDLHAAKVIRITGNGMVIAGYELVPRRSNNKASADAFRQAWWCLVYTLELADSLDLATLDDHFRVVPGTGTGMG